MEPTRLYIADMAYATSSLPSFMKMIGKPLRVNAQEFTMWFYSDLGYDQDSFEKSIRTAAKVMPHREGISMFKQTIETLLDRMQLFYIGEGRTDDSLDGKSELLMHKREIDFFRQPAVYNTNRVFEVKDAESSDDEIHGENEAKIIVYNPKDIIRTGDAITYSHTAGIGDRLMDWKDGFHHFLEDVIENPGSSLHKS